MQQYIDYLNNNFPNHTHLDITIRVLECLDYIKQHIQEVVSLVGKQKLFRHPINHMAIHLNGYSNPAHAQRDLLNLYESVKTSLQDLLAIKDELQRRIVVDGFMLNIIDSDVGCMEVRLKEALQYIGLYKSRGCESLDDIMARFSSHTPSLKVENTLNFFSELVEHRLPVFHQDKLISLNWDKVKNYLRDTIGWTELDKEWLKFFETYVGTKAVIYEQTSRRQNWHYHYFPDEQAAKLSLAYYKSILPTPQAQELEKASIKYCATQHAYFFALTHAQYSALPAIQSLGMQQSTSRKTRVRKSKEQEIVEIATTSSSDNPHKPHKIWHVTQFKQLAESLWQAKTVDWQAEAAKLKHHNPRLWANLPFIYRNHFSAEDIVKEIYHDLDLYVYSYLSQKETKYAFILIQFLLADSTIFFTSRYDTKINKPNYYFCLNNSQHSALAKLTSPDTIVKSVRFDPHCFLDDFLQGISRTPQNTTNPKQRFHNHKKYTVFAGGIAEYAQKKSPYPYNKEQLLAKKQKTSHHQATSLITFEAQNPVFGHTRNRRDKLVGFVFKSTKLINRMFRYDGGTIGRPYEHDDKSQALTYHYQKAMGPEPILFDSLAMFKQAIARYPNDYNEVLARLRIDLNTTSIGIFSDSFPARAIAQYYAYKMRQRLVSFYNELGLILDPDYEVPIVFYLPGTERVWKRYTQNEQAADTCLANRVLSNKIERRQKFIHKEFEFLLLVSRPDKVLEIVEQGLPLLIWLVLQEQLIELAEALYNRSSHSQIKSFAAYVTETLAKFNTKALPVNQELDGNTILHLAAAQGRYDLLPALRLNLLHKRNNNNETALHCAAKRNRIDACRVLINLGIDINIINQDGHSAFDIAKNHNYTELMALFIQHDVLNSNDCYKLLETSIAGQKTHLIRAILQKQPHLLNTKSSNGETPLILACKNGCIESVRCLLTHKPNLELAIFNLHHPDHNKTPLHLAIESNQTELVRLLLAAGANANSKLEKMTKHHLVHSNKTALQIAIAEKNHDIAVLLAKAGANLFFTTGWKRYGPIHIAIIANDLAMVKALIDNFSDLLEQESLTGVTPLLLACKKGKKDIVDYLLAKGANLEAAININDKENYGKTALCFAIDKQYPDIFNLLILAGANPFVMVGNKKLQPIHFAAINNQILVMQALLERHPKLIDVVDANNQSALIWACSKGHKTIAKDLISRGAMLDITTLDFGKTAVDCAIAQNYQTIAIRLLKAGAVYNQSIHPLIQQKQTKITKTLLAKNPKLYVNQQDKHGQSPLFLAWKEKNNELMIYLLQQGANPNIKVESSYNLDFINKMQLYLQQSAINPDFKAYRHYRDNQELKSMTLLHWAIITNNFGLASQLISAGANLAKPFGYEKLNIIHLIALHIDAASLFNDLLMYHHDELQALLNEKDVFGQTPLHIACQHNNMIMLNHLIGMEADLNIAINNPGHPNHGKTALHLAIEASNNQTADLMLIEAGANIKTTAGPMQWQPVHLAVQQGLLTTLKSLVSKDGSILLAKDRYGQTPLDLACEKNNYAIENYLRQQLSLPKITPQKAAPIITKAHPAVAFIETNTDKQQSAALKALIVIIGNNYKTYSKKHCLLSIFHRHGAKGRKRVDEWLGKLQKMNDLDALKAELLTYLSDPNMGNTHPHSFRTMLLHKLMIPNEGEAQSLQYVANNFTEQLALLKQQWAVNSTLTADVLPSTST